MGRALRREDGTVICSAITQIQVKLYCELWSVGQFVLVHDHILNFFDNFFLLHVGLPHRVIQPKVKVKSQSHVSVGRNL
jgi:hypothetical protein